MSKGYIYRWLVELVVRRRGGLVRRAKKCPRDPATDHVGVQSWAYAAERGAGFVGGMEMSGLVVSLVKGKGRLRLGL